MMFGHVVGLVRGHHEGHRRQLLRLILWVIVEVKVEGNK